MSMITRVHKVSELPMITHIHKVSEVPMITRVHKVSEVPIITYFVIKYSFWTSSQIKSSVSTKCPLFSCHKRFTISMSMHPTETMVMLVPVSELNFFLILKVANIRCFILIVVEIFHNIIRK